MNFLVLMFMLSYLNLLTTINCQVQSICLRHSWTLYLVSWYMGKSGTLYYLLYIIKLSNESCLKDVHSFFFCPNILQEVAKSVEQDFGSIDILVHALANGPEVRFWLL